MSRNITANMIAELAKSGVHPVLFCEIDFLSGPQYMWSGIGPITWNSINWLGVGSLAKIEPMVEDTQVQAQGCRLSLSGIPSTFISQALTECRQGAAVKIWFGFQDAAGAVIASPFQAFAGRLDVPSVAEGGDTSTIEITVESRLVDLQRPRERRYTSQDQQIDFAGDLGFDFVPAVQQWNGVWGKGKGVPYAPASGAGGGDDNSGGHGGPHGHGH